MYWVNRHVAGIALIFAGLPIGWAIRAAAGGGTSRIFTLAIYAIGLLLILNLAPLFRQRLHGHPLSLAVPGFCLLSLLVLALATPSGGRDIFGITGYIVAISFLIVIHTVSLHSMQRLPHAVMYVASVGCCLTILLTIISGDISFAAGQRFAGVGETASPGQLSRVGGLAIMAAVFLLAQRSKMKPGLVLLCYAAIGLGLVMITVTLSRSTYLSLFLCLAAAPYAVFVRRFLAPSSNRGGGLRPVSLTILLLVITGFVGLLLYTDLAETIAKFGQVVTAVTQSAFKTYVLGETFRPDLQGDLSTHIRRQNFELAWRALTPLGHGYKALHIDMPLLQGIHDLGIVPGVVFVLVALVVPALASHALLIADKTPQFARFVAYGYIFHLPSLFINGTPYSLSHWLALVFFYGTAFRVYLSIWHVRSASQINPMNQASSHANAISD